MKAGRLCLGLLIASVCLPARRTQSDEPAKGEKPAADSMVGKEAGDLREDNRLKMKLVWCPPGTFGMQPVDVQRGSITSGAKRPRPEFFRPKPPVRVLLTRGYWVGKHEVTRAEWKQVMETEPWKVSEDTSKGDDFPATFITWEGAMEFCRKVTESERKANRLPAGWEYTLPTEAQWERACRARTETRFSFGDDATLLDEHAWFRDNSRKDGGDVRVHPVGKKKSNPWGLCDMYGNAPEWCRDYRSLTEPQARDPEVKDGHGRRVVRGGSANSLAWECQSAYRTDIDESEKPGVGFRAALAPVQPAE